MKRRQFIHLVGATAAGLNLPMRVRAGGISKPSRMTKEALWKTVEVTTKVKVKDGGPGQLWLPLPIAKTTYQEHVDTLWTGNFVRAGILRDNRYNGLYFYAESENTASPMVLETTFRVRVRDRSWAEPVSSPEERELYLKPSAHVPTSDKIQEQAKKIVGKESNPDRKARRIYDWVVENSARDPKVRGCGVGDVKAMLESGQIVGKCADISSLFVGLCRAAGVPAREVFGLRVLPSALSKSIGKEGDVSGGQHCRAEYLSQERNGWYPVDPADVRKVILEENKSLLEPSVKILREKLFGFWEMNWIAFNSSRDFQLPPQPGASVNYLMYPFFKSASGKITKDGMDAKDFEYSIAAKGLS